MTTKEQYIHRLGRTARAGKGGSGLLLLADFEQASMQRELRGLDLHPCPLQATVAALAQETAGRDPGFQRARATSFDPTSELNKSCSQAYQAWLGFYNGNVRKLGWTPAELVQRANGLARAWGFPADPPALQKKAVGKMGLDEGMPGLNIDASPVGGGSGGSGGSDRSVGSRRQGQRRWQGR